MATFMCYFGLYPPSSSLCGAVNMNIQYLLPILLSQRVAIVSPRIKISGYSRIPPHPSLYILRPPALHSTPSQQTNRFNQIRTHHGAAAGRDITRGGFYYRPPLSAAIRSVPRLLLNVRLTIQGWYIYLSRHFKNVVIYKFEICICHRSFRP